MFVSICFIVVAIAISFIFCSLLIYQILSYPSGTLKMKEIAKIIRDCAITYMSKQYKIIFIVSILGCVVVYMFLGFFYVIGFLIGTVLSGFTGYIGMLVSVQANVRTTNAVRIDGLFKGLQIAFKSGCVTGLCLIGLSLLGIFSFYFALLFFNIEEKIILNSLIALGLGASLISIFARLGGGIFTKGADIGADLVGKLELNIPEDDYRNPAVIADNVGDNVGDCAGMAADLFETYCVTVISSMVLIGLSMKGASNVLILCPLVIASVCNFSTVIGMFFIKSSKKGIMFSLYRVFFIIAIISVILNFFVIKFTIGLYHEYICFEYKVYGINLYYCCLIGIFITGILIIITEYYTSASYGPVKSIAKASKQGSAMNIIQGLAVSMESTFLPVFFISVAILISYFIGGVIGISISATSMLSLAGIIVALDAYGPVTDNAGGISVMANLSEEVRKKTDILDSVGNITKAITKGYAIGSAGLASLVLFITYTEDLHYYFPSFYLSFSLKDPFVIVGLFIGGIIPYLFSAYSMKAVCNVASKVVIEVRDQFVKIKGILDGTGKPNYEKVITLLTQEAVKEMILPSLLPILFPVLLYVGISVFFDQKSAFVSLGALLVGTITVGIFLAISMTTGGGAWDNAKKYIENGNFGGKGSLVHKAAIVGDMVGDPFKDTAGPAINPLIKITNIVAILIVVAVAGMV